MCQNQCGQMGQFFKFLDDNFSYKSSPKSWWLFGLIWITSLFFKKTCCGYFLGNIWKKLGNFLLFHLVALATERQDHKSQFGILCLTHCLPFYPGNNQNAFISFSFYVSIPLISLSISSALSLSLSLQNLPQLRSFGAKVAHLGWSGQWGTTASTFVYFTQLSPSGGAFFGWNGRATNWA